MENPRAMSKAAFQNKGVIFNGDFLKSFPLQLEKCIALLVEKELEHMSREDYAKRLQNGDLDISVGRDAMDWIGKVHAHYKFEPLSA